MAKSLQQTSLSRLSKAYGAWKERLQLRRLVAGMWLQRRSGWTRALFGAWRAAVAAAQLLRRQLRRFQRQVRFRKASRGAWGRRQAVHGRLAARCFRRGEGAEQENNTHLFIYAHTIYIHVSYIYINYILLHYIIILHQSYIMLCMRTTCCTIAFNLCGSCIADCFWDLSGLMLLG